MNKINAYVKADCLECPQMKDVSEEDRAWVKEHNLNLNTVCNRCSRAFDSLTLEEAQWLKDRHIYIIGTCKDCGDALIIAPEEAVWLLENDLKLFKRCADCRQKNKDKKAQMDLLTGKTPETDDETAA